MKRPHLIEAAEAYRKYIEEGNISDEVKIGSEWYARGLIEGRKQGIAMERSRVRGVEWSKLALLNIITFSGVLGLFVWLNTWK